MHNRDTGGFDHWSTEGKGVFDQKKLGRDVLSVLPAAWPTARTSRATMVGSM